MPSLTPAELAGLRKTSKPPTRAPRRQNAPPNVTSEGQPTPPNRPEGVLVKELVRALRAIGVVAVRQNTGAVKEGDRFIRFGLKGCADILGIVTLPCPIRALRMYKLCGPSSFPACPACEGRGVIGLPLAVECKSAAGKLEPAQEAFLAMVNAAGGLGLVARSVDDVIPRVLRRMGQR